MGVVLILRLGGALRRVGVAAAGSTAVELDAGTGTSDTVALACAAGGSAGDRRGRAGARAAGSEGRDVGVGVGIVLGVLLRVLRVVNGRSGEPGGELLDGGAGEGLRAQSGAGVRLLWLGRLDLGRAEGAAFGDVRDAAGSADGLLGGSSSGGLARGDVEDVELAASGGLDDGVAGGIVRDVVAVDDVVVPVALALFQSLALEADRKSVV